MNNITDTIASSLLSKNLIDFTTEELKQLSERYPYSGGLQLLYAQKLKSANSSEFPSQWQKTLLYFNNPLFLQQILIEPKSGNEVAVSENLLIVTETNKSTEDPEEQNEAAPENLSEEDERIEQIEDEDITDEPESESGEALLNIPGLKIEPNDPAKAALSFTPYHTIDYFASQGIKLGSELNPADRFGNQLKTFTSWLKEMRRLPEAKVTSKFSFNDQSRVEKMAEVSLTGENAITEAMAEVWQKQGNPQKAIEVYKKLSLQNPAKSAFFAAKIEFLKKQI